jgi:predicted transcriptional regulator
MGRPETVGRAAVFSVRLRPDLRQKLENAARAEDTSLAEQIDRRLAQSFEDGAQNAKDRAVLRVLAEILRRLDAATGRRWADDPWTFGQAVQAITYLFQQWEPAGDAVPPTLPRSAEAAKQLGRDMVHHVLRGLEFSDDAASVRVNHDLGDLTNRGNWHS